MDGFQELHGRAPRTVSVAGAEVGRGSRVVLRPREGGDVMDRALAGQVAVVETIHEDLDGKLHLAVTLEDDPGRDLGERRQPGHRFFYSPEEVEPMAGAPPPPVRVLVACISAKRRYVFAPSTYRCSGPYTGRLWSSSSGP